MAKRFYVVPPDEVLRRPRTTEAYIVLYQKGWDDYGSKSLYQVQYNKDSDIRGIGEIKVISTKRETAQLPASFDTMPEEFLSLGQSLGVYRTLSDLLGPENAASVLTSLNDASLLPGKQALFEQLSWYQNSLLRTNEAQQCLLYGANALYRQRIPDESSFTYKCVIARADEPITLSFDFDSEDKLPRRICALIGRNGVGKTSILAQLALDLTDLRRISSERRRQRDELFVGGRPLFSRIVALSFSAFDEFRRPRPSEEISYFYCGVRDDEGRITRSGLLAKHRDFFMRVEELNRLRRWRELVEFIVGQDADLDAYENYLKGGEATESVRQLLSSGQNTLIYFVSALLAYGKKQALVLFDEPELHLHPNAIAQLMRILNELVTELECYAVLATHSALVLQEIPSKRVIYLRRTGNLTTVQPLGRETFGEDLASLNEEIFETVNVEYVYKDVLERLARRRSFEDVLELFDGRLGFHAMAYLTSLYGDESDAEDDD